MRVERKVYKLLISILKKSVIWDKFIMKLSIFLIGSVDKFFILTKFMLDGRDTN